MEFQPQPLSFPLSLILFLLLLLLLLRLKSKDPSKTPSHASPRLLPPGPRQLPLIGNIHHLFGRGPTHRVFRDLAGAFGPVLRLRLGQVDLVLVSSPQAAREVLVTHDLNFGSRPRLAAPEILCYGCKDIVFSPYGTYWRQLRRICVVELLSARRIGAFSFVREEENSKLIRGISMAGKSPVNLTEMFLSISNSIISRAIAFHKDSVHRQKFLAALIEALSLSSGFYLTDLFPSLGFIDTITGTKRRLRRLHHVLDNIFDEIIKEHQIRRKSGNSSIKESEEDLVDVLLRIKEGGELEIPLTMDGIKCVILDMFAGGSETTAGVLEWAMSELVRNPQAMEKAQTEVRSIAKGKAKVDESDIEKMHYLKLVVKETLRLHPPVPLLLPRVCSEECQVGGYTIPAKSRVMVNFWAMARDPGTWEEAESFRPERFDGSSVDFKGASFEYMPFGAGRRTCPGMSFGLVSVELTLARMLCHFNWQLPSGVRREELDMEETSGPAMRRKNDLHLVAIPW